jgi:DNA-binding response OmpR family regulator
MLFHGEVDGQGVPPIVLLVDEDQDTLDRYGRCFEREGLWVAAMTDPDEALRTTAELKPNLIVSEAEFAGRSRVADFIGALEQNTELRHTPLIVLSEASSQVAGPPQRGAVVLVKPVDPQALLSRADVLLRTSRELRQRFAVLSAKGQAQIKRAAELVARTDALTERVSASRRCPKCLGPLEWIERGAIAGVEYEYYRWCDHGCGLFCFQRNTSQWVKLA